MVKLALETGTGGRCQGAVGCSTAHLQQCILAASVRRCGSLACDEGRNDLESAVKRINTLVIVALTEQRVPLFRPVTGAQYRDERVCLSVSK